MATRSYVVGLAFNEDRNRVVLLNKQRPQWQKDYLNGPGGKIEIGETPLDAMIREFREETGVEIFEWKEIAQLHCGEVLVHFFKSFTTDIINIQTMTDEPVLIAHIDSLDHLQLNPNLRFLIPLALYGESSLSGYRIDSPIHIFESPYHQSALKG